MAFPQTNIQPAVIQSPAPSVSAQGAGVEVDHHVVMDTHVVAVPRRVRVPKKVVEAVITHDDSVRLNLKPVFPSHDDIFRANVLTQSLHPSDGVSNASDSVFVQLPVDSLQAQGKVADTVKLSSEKGEPHLSMKAKVLLPSHFNAELGWMLPVLIGLVAVTGWLRIASGKFFREMFQAVFYHTAAENLYKITHFRKSFWSAGLNFLFVLNLALFVFEVMVHFQARPGGLHGAVIWGIIAGSLLLLFWIKNGIYRLLGWVFNTREETGEFLFQVNLLNKAFGIMLLPFLVVIPYVHPQFELILIGAGFVLFATMYLVQLGQGAKIILRQPLSLFYMILYLCALEILPIVVLLKVVTLQSAR